MKECNILMSIHENAQKNKKSRMVNVYVISVYDNII